MNLPTFIKTIGNISAARMFGVSEGTIKSWRYHYRAPSPDNARMIERITGGAVTLAEIYAKNDKAAA